MEFTPERGRLAEKMFDAALKAKMNQVARKYGHGVVFEFWAWMAKTGCIKPYSCEWRWKPNMTLTEAIDCLDGYCNGLEVQLQKRQAMGNRRQEKNKKKGTKRRRNLPISRRGEPKWLSK